MPQPEISCIIPAYNEEKGIRTVLRAAYHHPLLAEIIVVDNGSRDHTSDIVKEFPGVKLIRQENRGKSVAVAVAITAAKGSFICSLDADLIGITPESITKIIEPVLTGKAALSISLRQNCPWFYRPIGLDFLSGERVYPKRLLGDNIEKLRRLPNFGIEVFMNGLIISQQLPIAIVFLPNVISPLKYHKEGLLTGFLGDLGMVRDILRTITLAQFFSQISHLLLLRVDLPDNGWKKAESRIQNSVSSS